MPTVKTKPTEPLVDDKQEGSIPLEVLPIDLPHSNEERPTPFFVDLTSDEESKAEIDEEGKPSLRRFQGQLATLENIIQAAAQEQNELASSIHQSEERAAAAVRRRSPFQAEEAELRALEKASRKELAEAEKACIDYRRTAPHLT